MATAGQKNEMGAEGDKGWLWPSLAAWDRAPATCGVSSSTRRPSPGIGRPLKPTFQLVQSHDGNA